MLFQPLHGDRVLRIAWHISHNSEHLHARANPPLLGLNLPDAQMQFDNCSLSASPHPIFSNIFGYIDISDSKHLKGRSESAPDTLLDST